MYWPPSKKIILAAIGGALTEVMVFALWQILGFSFWFLVVTICGFGALWILVYIYYPNDKPILSEPSPQVLAAIQPPQIPHLGNQKALAYANTIEHLTALDFWVTEWKEKWSPLKTRDEYFKSYGREIPSGLLDRQYIKASMRRDAEIQESYANRVAIQAMLSDFALETGKLKSLLFPDFEKMSGGQFETIKELVVKNARENKARVLKATDGWWPLLEPTLALHELNEPEASLGDLRKLFRNDPSEEIRIKAMKDIITSLRFKLHRWKDKERAGLGI